MSSILLATDTGPHLFWITSRAAGTAALLLSSVAVCVGLLMSGRFVRGRGADLRPLHEAVSLATIAALLVHALSLLGPSYYARRLIGQRRWVRMHQFTAFAWMAGLVHAFGEGTDAGSAWFVLLVAMATVPALLLLILRNFQGSVAK